MYSNKYKKKNIFYTNHSFKYVFKIYFLIIYSIIIVLIIPKDLNEFNRKKHNYNNAILLVLNSERRKI